LSHALWYAIPFLFLRPSIVAFLVIVGTRFVIDRYRLARYVVWGKNLLLGDTPPWKDCQFTGYPPDRPAWMAVWLLIIADNICPSLLTAPH
jgi:hypothetical protein